ncbi:MAG: cls [Candidatus Doudnabacteria bacterium]|nr:cls [Candidatus Doudnabacteria bacterium]
MNEFISLPWWVLVLLIVGISSIASTIGSLFLSIGRRPDKLSVPENMPTVDSEDFLQAVSGVVNAPIQTGGKALLLNNGNKFFPEIVKAINEAKVSVNFMVYIWSPGKASDMIFEAFYNALKRGVEVRVLLDGFGGSKVDKKKLEQFKLAGGKVCWFRKAHFGKLTRFYKRNHRRAIIIDGQIGFLGGAAVEDKWLGDAKSPESWRDSMVMVTGSMAENLQSAFSQVWADTQGEILLGSKYYPIAYEERRQMDLSKHISVISSPTSEFHPISNVYYLTFKAARTSIFMTHSYFVPDKALREVLKESARAGVDVRVLLPNNYIDGQTIRWASHKYFEEFLNAGVKIYEYQPTMIHSKTIVVDGKWSIVGSANMDVRSTELNKENILCILDDEFAIELEKTFLEDLKKAKRMRLGMWKKRAWPRKIRERVAALFEEQY